MKKKKMLIVIPVIICICGLLVCTKMRHFIGTNKETSEKQLQEINSNCIEIGKHEISMQTDTEGTAKIKVQLPKYEILYKEASVSENPEECLINTLKSGKYDTCEYEVEAKVTVENGKRVIHINEPVKALLEKVLSQAVNKLVGEDSE